MAITESSKLNGLLSWLNENAYWSDHLVEIRPSPCGGMGVFWRLGDEEDPNQELLLLRVPKSNVLSPKNSFIYPLLVDHESTDQSIDLSKGMHAIVLAYIYELDLGKNSPWHSYLASFSPEKTPVPICLWDDSAKEALFNTECDLLNMLDASELGAFYLECVKFAHNNKAVLPVPELFEMATPSIEKIKRFGQYVQAVVSRSFPVDQFHGLSLVPGADLFNHLSPVDLGEIVEERENVHFECDDDDEICEFCGETGCPHAELDSEEEEEDDDDNDEDNEDFDEKNAEITSDVEETSGGEDQDDDLTALLDADMTVEDSEPNQSETEHEQSDMEDIEDIEEDSDNENLGIDEEKPITLEDIQDLEEDSDTETVQDEEEASTVSLSDDDSGDDETRVSPTAFETEVAENLKDGSKCCDMVLIHPPLKKFQYEIFSTYGNDLLNPFLLQRYGFVTANNPNTTCILLVQMLREIKKCNKTTRAEEQMNLKLQWYEDIGFDLVNELSSKCASRRPRDDNDDDDDDDGAEEFDESNNDETKRTTNECKEKCCGESEVEESPENWQLSPKISSEGRPTTQTLALVRLIHMHFNIFYHKLYRSPSRRRLEKRVSEYLMAEKISDKEKSLLKRWIQDRLDRYKPIGEVSEDKRAFIEIIRADEETLLRKALAALS